MKNVTVNKDQGLYVIPERGGYSCLGFEVCYNRTIKLADEMGIRVNLKRKGTKKAYQVYQKLVKIARQRNAATGWRSESELTPELIGKEGQRVEVVTSYGEKMRFIVGKSTGFIPCHLMIMRSNSHGGGAVVGSPFKSIHVLRK